MDKFDNLCFKEVVMTLVYLHPDWRVADIRDKVEELGYDRPSRLLISYLRKEFLASLKFLVERGLVDPDARPKGDPDLRRKPRPRKPEFSRRPEPRRPESSCLKKPTAKRYTRHFYAKDHD